MNQLLKDQKGFSLLEILIALAIAAGLYGTLIVNISNPHHVPYYYATCCFKQDVVKFSLFLHEILYGLDTIILY